MYTNDLSKLPKMEAKTSDAPAVSIPQITNVEEYKSALGEFSKLMPNNPVYQEFSNTLNKFRESLILAKDIDPAEEIDKRTTGERINLAANLSRDWTLYPDARASVVKAKGEDYAKAFEGMRMDEKSSVALTEIVSAMAGDGEMAMLNYCRKYGVSDLSPDGIRKHFNENIVKPLDEDSDAMSKAKEMAFSSVIDSLSGTLAKNPMRSGITFNEYTKEGLYASAIVSELDPVYRQAEHALNVMQKWYDDNDVMPDKKKAGSLHDWMRYGDASRYKAEQFLFKLQRDNEKAYGLVMAVLEKQAKEGQSKNIPFLGALGTKPIRGIKSSILQGRKLTGVDEVNITDLPKGQQIEIDKLEKKFNTYLPQLNDRAKNFIEKVLGYDWESLGRVGEKPQVDVIVKGAEDVLSGVELDALRAGLEIKKKRNEYENEFYQGQAGVASDMDSLSDQTNSLPDGTAPWMRWLDLVGGAGGDTFAFLSSAGLNTFSESAGRKFNEYRAKHSADEAFWRSVPYGAAEVVSESLAYGKFGKAITWSVKKVPFAGKAVGKAEDYIKKGKFTKGEMWLGKRVAARFGYEVATGGTIETFEEFVPDTLAMPIDNAIAALYGHADAPSIKDWRESMSHVLSADTFISMYGFGALMGGLHIKGMKKDARILSMDKDALMSHGISAEAAERITKTIGMKDRLSQTRMELAVIDLKNEEVKKNIAEGLKNLGDVEITPSGVFVEAMMNLGEIDKFTKNEDGTFTVTKRENGTSVVMSEEAATNLITSQVNANSVRRAIEEGDLIARNAMVKDMESKGTVFEKMSTPGETVSIIRDMAARADVLMEEGASQDSVDSSLSDYIPLSAWGGIFSGMQEREKIAREQGDIQEGDEGISYAYRVKLRDGKTVIRFAEGKMNFLDVLEEQIETHFSDSLEGGRPLAWYVENLRISQDWLLKNGYIDKPLVNADGDLSKLEITEAMSRLARGVALNEGALKLMPEPVQFFIKLLRSLVDKALDLANLGKAFSVGVENGHINKDFARDVYEFAGVGSDYWGGVSDKKEKDAIKKAENESSFSITGKNNTSQNNEQGTESEHETASNFTVREIRSRSGEGDSGSGGYIEAPGSGGQRIGEESRRAGNGSKNDDGAKNNRREGHGLSEKIDPRVGKLSLRSYTTKNKREDLGVKFSFYGGEILEIESSPEGASLFREKIEEGKSSQFPYGECVYTYEVEEYEHMRLFLLPSGKAGFALKDGDMVSVFSCKDASIEGKPALSIIALAIELGATKCDCYGTILPSLYSGFGFKAVARDSFNEEFAPDSMKEHGHMEKYYNRYNNGRPDIVYMVYKGNRDSVIDDYNPYLASDFSNLPYTDYDTCVSLQDKEIKKEDFSASFSSGKYELNTDRLQNSRSVAKAKFWKYFDKDLKKIVREAEMIESGAKDGGEFIARLHANLGVVRAATSYLPEKVKVNVRPYLTKLEMLAEMAATGKIDALRHLGASMRGELNREAEKELDDEIEKLKQEALDDLELSRSDELAERKGELDEKIEEKYRALDYQDRVSAKKLYNERNKNIIAIRKKFKKADYIAKRIQKENEKIETALSKLQTRQEKLELNIEKLEKKKEGLRSKKISTKEIMELAAGRIEEIRKAWADNKANVLMIDLVKEVDNKLTEFLKDEAISSMQKMIDRVSAKTKKNRNQEKGKIGAEHLSWMNETIVPYMEMDEDQVSAEEASLEANIIRIDNDALGGNISKERKDALEKEAEILHQKVIALRTFGGLKDMSLDELLFAQESLHRFISTGRAKWTAIMNTERERRDKMKNELNRLLPKDATKDRITNARMEGSSKSGRKGSLFGRFISMIESPLQFFSDIAGKKGMELFALTQQMKLSKMSLEASNRATERRDRLKEMMSNVSGEKKTVKINKWLLDWRKIVPGAVSYSSTTSEEFSIPFEKAEEIAAFPEEAEKWGYDSYQAKAIIGAYEEAISGGKKISRKKKLTCKVTDAPTRSKVTLSKDIALKVLMICEQEDYKEMAIANGWDEQAIVELRDFVGKEGMLIREWLLKEYEIQGDYLAEEYERVMGVPFIRREGYSPADFIAFDKMSSKDVEQLLANGSTRTGANAGFLKVRQKHGRDINTEKGALMVYQQHMALTDNWVITNGWVRDMKSVLGDYETANKLVANIGVTNFALFKTIVESVEQGGIRGACSLGGSDKLIKDLMNTKAVGVLGFKPWTWMKQYSAVMNSLYGDPDVDSIAFLKSLAKCSVNKGAMKWGEMKKQDFMKRRFMGSAEILERASTRQTGDDMHGGDVRAQESMVPMGAFDVSANIVGACALYDVVYTEMTERGSSHTEANDEALRRVGLSLSIGAQPMGWMEKSIFQTSSNGVGLMNFMFMSEAINKLGLVVMYGKQKRWGKMLQVYFMSGVLNQLMGVFIDYFKDDEDRKGEDDWTAYALGVLLGPVTGIPIICEVDSIINNALSACGVKQRFNSSGLGRAIFDTGAVIRAVKSINNDNRTTLDKAKDATKGTANASLIAAMALACGSANSKLKAGALAVATIGNALGWTLDIADFAGIQDAQEDARERKIHDDE